MALFPKSSSHSPLPLCFPSQAVMKVHIRQSPMNCTNKVKLASSTKKDTFTVPAATATPNLESETADQDQSRMRVVFLGRTWNARDMAAAALKVMENLLCLLAPFTFSWAAFWVALGITVVTGLLGITLCYHRCLTHRSFKLPKWLEYLFAYCGVQACQWDPINWVSVHRFHHEFVDSERDPHSPLEGFWHSHMWWVFDSDTLIRKCGESNNVGDLKEQSFYKFIERTYLLHQTAFAVLLYAIGGMPFIVWGMGVRLVVSDNVTFFVNSACHLWGKQHWNTGDLSRNNWLIGILAFGEGWHNNHHAFKFSARHGLEWWQIDVTWYVIKFLEAVGLATDVKLPTDSQKQKMARGPGSSKQI